MPMTTCQPGHRRLSCPILFVLAWLVLYGLQDVRNGEARNRSTMRTLAKTTRLSPVTVRLVPVTTVHDSWVFLAENDSHTQRGPSTGIQPQIDPESSSPTMLDANRYKKKKVDIFISFNPLIQYHSFQTLRSATKAWLVARLSPQRPNSHSLVTGRNSVFYLAHLISRGPFFTLRHQMHARSTIPIFDCPSRSSGPIQGSV
jgi:hypothetical protein